MITIRVDGIPEVKKMLEQGGKQARFAAAVALTKTAKRIEAELQKDMREGFQSASPYAIRSQFVSPAKPATLTAIVGIKDLKPSRGTSPAVLLGEHFSGQIRGNKPMEVAMRAMGALESGYAVVPGAGIKADRYGNPNRNAVSEVLGALKRGVNVYSGRGKRMATLGYFVVPVTRTAKTQHLQPGIYRRITRGAERSIIPVFLFIKLPGYRKLFDLPRLAQKVVGSEFGLIFEREYLKALNTAR